MKGISAVEVYSVDPYIMILVSDKAPYQRQTLHLIAEMWWNKQEGWGGIDKTA